MAVWHAGNTISNIISGFLAAGILEHMKGLAGLRSWQWFFLIEGAISIVVAVAAFFLLPDFPNNTRWLSQQEQEIAQYRVLVSNGGKDEGIGGTWDGVKEAVRDPFTWLFCGMHFALITAQSFKDFFPSVSAPSSQMLSKANTPSLDSRNFWLRQDDHLPCAGTTIYNRLYLSLCICMVIRQVSGIMLPHNRPHSGRSCRNLDANIHHECRCSLLRHHTAHQWYLQWAQSSALLGNDSCTRASEQESCFNCHCQLHLPDKSLVQPILLSNLTRTILPTRRRTYCLWLSNDGSALLGYPMEGTETKC